MKLAVISFTGNGSLICGRLIKRMRELGWDCSGTVPKRYLLGMQEAAGIGPALEPVMEWTRARFDQVDGLIYIGAAGIAVRAIAPNLKDKLTDPAVLVIDEAGKHVISLLSGHVGGANELTETVAAILGAQPVITTASDVRQITAIDVWAKNRGLVIKDRTAARQVAACLLDGEPVGFYSDYLVEGGMPEGFVIGERCRIQVWVTARKKPPAEHMITLFLEGGDRILRLVPRTLVVGIGCRKGIRKETVMEALTQVFSEENLDMEAISAVTSIDIKREETGLCAAAETLQVPFYTYPAGELDAVQGSVTPSEFVKKVTGTDNVCERSALAGAGEGGRLLVKKRAMDGVTLAIAEIAAKI